MTRHTWIDSDDAQLSAAVEACLPLREVMPARGQWWAAVVGRAGLPISPEAARARWERLDRARREATGQEPQTEQPDAWTRIAQLVEEYERSVGEATLDTATEIRAQLHALDASIQRTEHLVLALCRAWSVEVPTT